MQVWDEQLLTIKGKCILWSVWWGEVGAVQEPTVDTSLYWPRNNGTVGWQWSVHNGQNSGHARLARSDYLWFSAIVPESGRRAMNYWLSDHKSIWGLACCPITRPVNICLKVMVLFFVWQQDVYHIKKSTGHRTCTRWLFTKSLAQKHIDINLPDKIASILHSCRIKKTRSLYFSQL